MGIGSDRAEEMLDEHRDNFVWAARQVPRAHARAIGQSGNGWARSFWVYLSSILMENDIQSHPSPVRTPFYLRPGTYLARTASPQGVSRLS